MEDKSIKELLMEMNEKLEDPQKIKKFRTPFKSKISKRRARKGWVTIMKILENRNIEFERQQVSEQTVVLDGVPRFVTPEETMLYKGKPFVIIPNWSVKPFSPTENYDNTVKEQYATQGYKLLLNRMQVESISPKKKVGLAIVFIVIIALIVAGYFLSKGGVF